jgi:hypothetical protein
MEGKNRPSYFIFASIQATARCCSESQNPSRTAATPSSAHSQFFTGCLVRQRCIATISVVQGVSEAIARQLPEHSSACAQCSTSEREQISRQALCVSRDGPGTPSGPPPTTGIRASADTLGAGLAGGAAAAGSAAASGDSWLDGLACSQPRPRGPATTMKIPKFFKLSELTRRSLGRTGPSGQSY